MIEIYGLQVLRDRGSGNLTFFIFTLILSEFIIYVITLLFGTEPETLFKSILSPVTIIGNVAVSDWDKLGGAGRRLRAGPALRVPDLDAGGSVSQRRRGQRAAGGAVRHQREARLAGRIGDRGIVHRRVDVPDRHAWRRGAELAAGTDPDRRDRHTAGRHRPRVRRRRGRGIPRPDPEFFDSVIGSRWQNLLLYGVLFATIVLFPRGVRTAAASAWRRRDDRRWNTSRRSAC